MFQNCASIRTLSLNFDTSSVTKMDNMFKNCKKLVYLYLINFNTKNVETMASMFENCINMEILDLSNFDTTSVMDISSMFDNCISMEYINIKDFSIKNIIDYNNIFSNTAQNLVFCLDETKDDNSIMLNILNQKICSINTCETEWRNSQKIVNIGESKCVDKCLDNEILIYQFKSQCRDQCPNDTFLENEETYQCILLCPEELPFFSVVYTICIDDCEPYNFFNEKCTINNPLITLQDKMTLRTDNDLLTNLEFNTFILKKIIHNNESLIIASNELIYQISPIEKGIKIKTKINFSKIKNDLKKIFNLNSTDKIVVFSTEIKVSGIKIPIVEYNIYDLNTGTKLDLSKVSNLELNITYPVIIDENNEYKYNPYDKYYFDPCTKAESEDGVDMIINDRINEFINNNYSLCEKNCIYKGYNSNSKTAECLCKIKTTFKTITEVNSIKDFFEQNFKGYNAKTNFYLFSCIKLLLEKNIVYENVGSYIIIFFFIIFLVIFFLFIKYGYDNIRIIASIISNAKFQSLAHAQKTKTLYSRQKTKIFSQSSNISNKPILEYNYINFRILNHQQLHRLNHILQPTDLEKNLFFSYDLALQKDKRHFFDYYFSLIRRKNLIIFTFCPITDYNIRITKIYLIFFDFFIFLKINTFFIDESLIHQIYIDHGRYNFIANITRIIYSLLISKVIIFSINLLVLTDKDIIGIKQITKKELIGIYYIKFLKTIFIRYIIFAIINICIFIFAWIYISCFCAIFKNTFRYLLINTILCFIGALLYPFIFCFIPSLLRYYALWDLAMDREWLYKISRIVQIL